MTTSTPDRWALYERMVSSMVRGVLVFDVDWVADHYSREDAAHVIFKPELRPRGERDQGAEAVAEASVENGGDVAGADQVPFGEDLGGVQADQFGGAQGAP